MPGSDPTGDIASALRQAGKNPAARATAGVVATQLIGAVATRAGAIRLGVFVSEELIPIVGEAAAVYVAASAVNDAATYYNDNVGACSQ